MQGKDASPSLLEIFKNVFMALIGVQSRRAHERDFAKGRAGPYIFVGIAVITLAILTLLALVRLILHLTNS